MRKYLVAGTVALTVLLPGMAAAQQVIEVERPSRGPVGDIVGGALVIPGAVIESVIGEPRGRSIVVEEEVVVGRPLPTAVEIRPVPRHQEYAYAIVNDRRVIVEPRTRKVVRIIEN